MVTQRDRQRYEANGVCDENLIATLEEARAELLQRNGTPVIELTPGEVSGFYHHCNLRKEIGQAIRAGNYGLVVRVVRETYRDVLKFFTERGFDCGSNERATDGMVKNMLAKINFGSSFGR